MLHEVLVQLMTYNKNSLDVISMLASAQLI